MGGAPGSDALSFAPSGELTSTAPSASSEVSSVAACMPDGLTAKRRKVDYSKLPVSRPLLLDAVATVEEAMTATGGASQKTGGAG